MNEMPDGLSYSCPGHEIDSCWALRHKIQDLIEIVVAPPISQNIGTNPILADTAGPSNPVVNLISKEEGFLQTHSNS